MLFRSNNSELYYDFNIIAPLLQNYKYRLFQVAFDIGSLYPIEIFLDDDLGYELGHKVDEEDNSKRAPIRVHSDSEFEDLLKSIFNTRITRNIIKNLKESSGEPDPE